MIVFCPKEPSPESRVALDPDAVRKLVKLGFNVRVEASAGLASKHPDEAYAEAGASVSSNRHEALRQAEIVLAVESLNETEIALLRPGSLHVSFLNPFARKDLLNAFCQYRVSAVSMEMMPRTTLAQKMDAISSQANLAGYFAVILGASRLGRILPMMMTPAGTISPAKVFVIGVGVAGLQAIATAKRLGARVEAFDTRPVVEEQVRSLGARFVKIDIGETGQSEQGYARELTPEQLDLQRAGMAKVCAQSDLVITTAKLFGKPAPKIVTRDMVMAMKPGSVIVDLAAETGGNVEGTRPGEDTLTDNGVLIVGHKKLETCIPFHATQVYAANLANFIEHFWDTASSTLRLNMEDPILKGCLLTHDGAILDKRFTS